MDKNPLFSADSQKNLSNLFPFLCGPVLSSAFRLRPTIEWTHEKWAALEGLAQEFGLTIDVENAIHLQQGPERKEIASIHEIGVENDICIIPDYEHGNELLEALGSRIFRARTDEES